MKRETAPCQHDNSIIQTQPRKGLDNHSPSAAVLRPGARAQKAPVYGPFELSLFAEETILNARSMLFFIIPCA